MKRSRLTGALALLLVFSALFLFASCGFSYEKSKIGKYVDLSREDYYGLTVSIPAAKEIGEKDIDLEIATFRLHLRTLVSEGEVTRHAAWGDNVNLYYHITVANETGSFLPLDGFSNMTEGEPGPFVIGGGVLLDWSHSGIYYKGIRSMAFTDDGTCWTLLRDLTTGETELLCLSPSAEAAERIVVDALYAETGSRIVPVSAMLYNAAQDRVFVRCREVTSVSSENYDLSELNRLILSSREGDVLVFPEGYETYARRGLLYDLDSLMRTDSNVNRSSIYENALPPFEVNGTVYALTPVFRLEGIAMKEKNAGLSLGDLLRSHERRVLMTETKDAVSDLLLKHGVWDYLSPDLDSCAFDSPAFADCLGIIDSFPEENRSGRIPTSERPYENDRVLVAWAQIGSLTDYLEAKLLFGNEAVSFLGYPSSASGGEGGFVVSCRDTISVSSRTAVPEEAWEFVKFMLSGEALKAAGITNSGIPLLKSVSRDVVEGLMGEWSYDTESNWLDGRGMGGIPVSVDEACAEEYLALLEAARVDLAVPGQVDAILGEELSAFFAGARSAEETGRMIQNRISNYLNERK